MKRFWTEAAVAESDRGWLVRLDGKTVNTPRRVPLLLPNEAVADAVCQEWSAVGETLDPRSMPLTGLANAAIDHADRAGFAAALARYGETDLFCYRAENPPGLLARQATEWDPFLAWARRRYDIELVVAPGVIHRPQPPLTLMRLTAAVDALDRWRLAGLNPIVTIGGSLIGGLALLEEAFDERRLWDATQLDELWQAGQWGEDAEAATVRAARRDDFSAAARFLRLL